MYEYSANTDNENNEGDGHDDRTHEEAQHPGKSHEESTLAAIPDDVMEAQEQALMDAKKEQARRDHGLIPPAMHSPGNCPNCNLYLVETDTKEQEDGAIMFSCPRCGHNSNRRELTKRE